MSNGPEARKWFISHHNGANNKLYTSKYYTPEESWPKTRVWWFQIPPTAIDIKFYEYVNLVCQIAPNKNDFHYLKVPTKFLQEHLEKFHRVADKISIYLSANPNTLFIEERGKGR